MPSGSKHWCFTWNNYDDDSLSQLQLLAASPDVVYLIAGRELAPTTATPHLQGFISFVERQRFTFVHSLLPSCHLESARGSPDQNRKYCSKSGDFSEYGTLPSGAGKRTDWEQFRDWCSSLPQSPSERTLMEEWPSLWGRYSSATRNMAATLAPRPILRTGEATTWQTSLAADLEQAADDRTVRFYVDPIGGSGKSWFCGYLFGKRDDVQLLSSGRRDDIAYAVDTSKRIFLFNIGRGQLEFLNYGILEGLKDRMVMSTKYASQMKLLNETPHVVVFCNEEPDMTKMSEDRYIINNLS